MHVLEFIKTHLTSLLCGVVAILAVAVGVLGMSSETVVKKMKQEISRIGAASIRSLKTDAKNEDIIAAEKQRGELFQQRDAVNLPVVLLHRAVADGVPGGAIRVDEYACREV